MSAPKSRCNGCREPLAACVCEDDDVLDLPDGFGPLLRSMMGGGDPEPGVHVLHLPETEEEMRAAPLTPTIVVKATKRGTCRHCRTPVTYGPKGWRDDEGGLLAYGCMEAPLGFHQP